MPFDEAQKKEIADLVAAQLKAPEFTATLGEAVKAGMSGLKLEDTVKAQVAEAVKGLKPPEDPPGGKGKDKPGDEAAQRIAALEKTVEAEREARRQAEQKARTDRLHSETRAALLKAGVPQDRVHLALAAIKDGGALSISDDGALGWKGKDKFGVDTTLTLEEGAKAWAGTSDGKAFLPPTGAQGTGDGAGGVGGAKGPSTLPKREDGTYDLSQLRGRVGRAIVNADVEPQ